MLSCLFVTDLWSPAWKGLTSWLFLVMFTVFFLLSHVVSWEQVWYMIASFLIFAIFPGHTHLFLLLILPASFVSYLSHGNCDSQFSMITR